MFDFSNFIDVGDYLSTIDEEAYVRSAIGRYYYASLGKSRLYLIYSKNQSQFLSKYNIHQKIIDKLKSSDDDTEVSIGEKLNEMRKFRNDADYAWDSIEFKDFKKYLNFASRESKVILTQIEALSSFPPFKI